MEPVALGTIVDCIGAEWVGQKIPDRTLVAEVSTDTRHLSGRPLFVALTGDNFDGHKFVGQAAQRGAVASVVARSAVANLPEDSGPLLVVDDPLVSMERLARWNRDRLDVRVVSVTGSVGKTSTKEFLGTILSERYRVTTAPKSFNNRIGVATTLLSAGPSTEVLVTELGTSGPGEISHLSKLVRPERVILTEIAPSHLAGLGDLAGVLAAKSEIFDGLSAGGNAYLRKRMFGFDSLKERAPGPVKTFGWSSDADYCVTDCERVWLGDPRSVSGSKAYGYHFTVNGCENFLLPVPGRHNVLNAAAAIGVARDLGLSWQDIRSALAICRLPPLRLQVVEVKGVLFMNDCYNASPRSMEVAIDEWAAIGQEVAAKASKRAVTASPSDETSPRGGLVAVLGDMLELGDHSQRLHEQLGRRLAKCPLRLLVTVGRDSSWVQDAYRSLGGEGESEHFTTVEDAIPFLRANVRSGDQMLVKGSRQTGLERVFNDLHRWVKLFGAKSQKDAALQAEERMSMFLPETKLGVTGERQVR